MVRVGLARRPCRGEHVQDGGQHRCCVRRRPHAPRWPSVDLAFKSIEPTPQFAGDIRAGSTHRIAAFDLWAVGLPIGSVARCDPALGREPVSAPALRVFPSHGCGEQASGARTRSVPCPGTGQATRRKPWASAAVGGNSISSARPGVHPEWQCPFLRGSDLVVVPARGSIMDATQTRRTIAFIVDQSLHILLNLPTLPRGGPCDDQGKASASS